jgi:Heterokaryon incompatibility protein (HET)
MPARKIQNSYLSLPGPRHAPEFSLKSRSSKTVLDTLGNISDKSEACPFCSLVTRSITDPQSDADQLSLAARTAKCYVNWEVDGREAASGREGHTKGRTRRIHLSWDDKSLKESYLVFVAPERYLRPNSDARHVWGNEALFLGRGIDTYGGNQALIKSWLDLCCKSHSGPCRDPIERGGRFDDMISQSYFGVIDVLNMQLTSLPSADTPYVALSYVWGQGDPYTTILSNIMLHRGHGGLDKFLPDLPPVIRDSIDLVRRLGMQYIWIDSLCIVQDSPRSWNLNARAMDLVYGNAKLTICAADGHDSSTGLKAMHAKEYDVCQYKEECAPGVRLMVSRPPEMGIRASKWNTRAWTFQERLLSRRCLIFTEGRVYFQCRSTGMSEDIFADREGAGWSLDLVDAPLQMFRELNRRALWVYVNCVSLYTIRDLTKPKDILAAASGICNLIEKTMQSPFIFGLPSSHFDLALLWEPQGPIKRRAPRNEKERSEYNGVEFPSWSWCGWMDAKMEYKPGMVEGCLTNLHEWLTKHTWILWYIRDGHGNLRPLRNAEKSSDDRSTEKRWRGYRSCRDGRHNSRIQDRCQVVVEKNGVVTPRGRNDELYERQLEREKRRERERQLVQEKQQLERQRERENRKSDGDDNWRERDYEVWEEFSDEDAQNRWGTRYYVESRDIRYNDDIQERRYDDYGRIVSDKVARNQKDFRLTLPENPYRVVTTEYSSEPDKEFPDQPILQFWTWHTFLHVVLSDNPYLKLEKGLCRCDIVDENGDWCGSLVLNEDWIRNTECSRHNFIAISDAKAFTQEECDIWTYYIPKGRDQSEWDLYYVLLVECMGLKWQRVALGKVFKAAFSNAEWKEIILG